VTFCGETARRLALDGLVWRVREKTWKPGPYDVRVAVRNAAAQDQHSLGKETLSVRPLVPIKVGSASQYLEIPNLSAIRLAVAGLTLGGVSLKETADSQMQGVAARVAANGDPGVRRFRAGEAVQYEWRVLSAPGRSVSPVKAHISVVRDGKEVFSGPPAKLTFVNNEAQVTGVYRIESLEPGRYWLAATAAEKTDKGKTKRTATEWLHFDVSD
jgi:hypothetical protein